MKTKDEIGNYPFYVLLMTQKHYNNFTLYVQIELTNQKDDLFLLASGKGMCIGEGHRHHDYDKHGQDFFNDLMENFGKVWVLIPGETKPIEYNSYEDLLNEIPRD